jgi:hypothetical protein
MTPAVPTADRLDLAADLPDEQLAAAVDGWLRENLPADWLAAADAGRWSEVAAILADPERAAACSATPAWPPRPGRASTAASG